MTCGLAIGQHWLEPGAGELISIIDLPGVDAVFKRSGAHTNTRASAVELAQFLSNGHYALQPSHGPLKPTIPLRIRVGVTADGKWSAFGHHQWKIADASVQGDLGGAPVVAWHWITAEIPMPETEQGETKGTVEP